MKVKELIEKLQAFAKEHKNGENMDVYICDGYQAITFHGNFQIALYEDECNQSSCDIGVGGLRV